MKLRPISFMDNNHRRDISTVGLHTCERACDCVFVFVVAGCGVSDRVGRPKEVEITLLCALHGQLL